MYKAAGVFFILICLLQTLQLPKKSALEASLHQGCAPRAMLVLEATEGKGLRPLRG
jgi:hypothetical protein